MTSPIQHLRYCMYGAGLARVGKHPQTHMREMGINWQHSMPQSMGDQWWFWNCSGIPDLLPPFVTKMENDPMECIGYGLSRSEAESIRDFSPERQKVLDALLESSGHGTRMEDVERIFNAGAKAEADKWRPVLAEVLEQAKFHLLRDTGDRPNETDDYTGWDEKAQSLIDGGGK